VTSQVDELRSGTETSWAETLVYCVNFFDLGGIRLFEILRWVRSHKKPGFGPARALLRCHGVNLIVYSFVFFILRASELIEASSGTNGNMSVPTWEQGLHVFEAAIIT